MSSLTEALAQQTGTVARRAGNKVFRGVQEATKTVRRGVTDGPVESILMWPPVENGHELADLFARLRWYLPTDCTIQIPADNASLDPSPVAWFNEDDQRSPTNVHVVEIDAITPNPDLILVWKEGRRSYFDRRLLRDIERVTIVDPEYLASNEPMAYTRLTRETLPSGEADRLQHTSKAAYTDLLDDAMGASRILLFGTGPSMRQITPTDADADLVIVCNSAVRDPEWIAATQPKVIAFADPTFHFSPNRYARQFWRDLDTAVAVADPWLVTLDIYVPLIARHMPHLIDRTIGLSATGTGDIAVPSPDDPRVVRTANVLTLVMLPMAASLGNEIAIAGCDGREKSETYFWRHSSEGQYSDDLMATVHNAHPAVFRDRNLGGYYKAHCDTLDRQISGLEARGTRVSCATPSLIPALAARM